MAPKRISALATEISQGAAGMQDNMDKLKRERDTAIAKCVSLGSSVEDMSAVLNLSTCTIRSICKELGAVPRRKTAGGKRL